MSSEHVLHTDVDADPLRPVTGSDLLVQSAEQGGLAYLPSRHRADAVDPLQRGVGGRRAPGGGRTKLVQKIAADAQAQRRRHRVRSGRVEREEISRLLAYRRAGRGDAVHGRTPVIDGPGADLPARGDAPGHGEIGRKLPVALAG